MAKNSKEPKEIRLIHSSDVHVDEPRIAANYSRDGAAMLASILSTARKLQADIVLLAGDTFETNQLSRPVIDRVGNIFADAGLPIVVLQAITTPPYPTRSTPKENMIRSRASQFWV